MTMQELIKENGYMDNVFDKGITYYSNVNKYPKKYKGFLIERAIGRFNKVYYTAVNIKNKQHCHDVSEKLIHTICNCAYELNKYHSILNKYDSMVRNKAMRLVGFYIKS